MICNKCGENIKEFGCTFDAKVHNYYELDEKTNKFILSSQEIEDDGQSEFYCGNCGCTLDKSVFDEIEF